MSLLRLIYALLAVLGAVLPMRHFVAWFQENGWSVSGLIDAWFVNRAAEGLVYDLTISAIAVTVWIVAEVWVRRNWLALVAVPAIYLVGLSCGLPLYLFLRTRQVA